jgi:hypothetical protein
VSDVEKLARMRRAARRAGRRLRHQALLGRLALLLPLPLGYAALALALIKLAKLDSDAQAILLYVGAAVVILVAGACLQAWLKAPPRWAGALLLDRHHGLGGRLSTALELSEGNERSSLAGLAIQDGIGVAEQLQPGRAVPIAVPRELWVSAALALFVFGISLVELRTVRVLPMPAHFEPLVLSGDDLDLFGAMAEELGKKSEDPAALAAIRRFNTLIEDIAARRLERKDALSRLAELEAELGQSLDADQEARKLGLDGLARELSRSGLTKPAAEALEEARLKDAEKALRELSERLKRKDKAPTRAELDRLRQALERAGNASVERQTALEQRRRELEEERKSLLKKHKGDEKAMARDAKAQENGRKLERLQRDKQRADKAQRELSELDRELAEAARALKQEMKQQGAENLEQAAEHMNQMAKKQLSEQEKRELLQRLRDLREVVRRQGQGGSDRNRQMQRFSERARGKRQGEGQGQSKPGQGQKPGQSPGNQRGKNVGVELLEVPQMVEVPGGQGPGRPGDDSGGGDRQAGTAAGSGHDAASRGESTKPVGSTHDVAAAGIDTGQGTASAEVIYGAAERGFVGKGYKEVFDQYEGVAEEALEHDTIPPGYRFYVRRYFQLIRPRD